VAFRPPRRWLLALVLLGLTACGPATTGSSSPASGALPAAPARSEPAASPTAAAAGRATSAESSGEPTKLIVSYSQVTGNEIPLWVAYEAGIFQQNGLAPELRLIEGNKGIAALLAGETQFADIGGSQTLAAAANGADLTILGIIGPKFPFLFMVPASIQSADDLRGKNVGVSTIGDSSDIATRLALPRLGLDPNTDVTIVATGSSQNRRTALLNGALQGGMATMPESLSLEAQGFHTLVDLTALDLPTATQGEVAQRSYVAAHPDVAQRFMDSFVEAVARARRDKAFTVDVLKKYYQSTDDQAMNMTYDFYVGKVIPPLPYPKPEQFAEAQATLGATDEKVRQYDLSQLLDPSFVESAASRGLDR
jgi:NitT/TauT family transport system substrate-binding protein